MIRAFGFNESVLLSEVDKDVNHLYEMNKLERSLSSFKFTFDNEEKFIAHKALLLKCIENKGDENSAISGKLRESEKAKLFRLCQLIVKKTVNMVAEAHSENEIKYLNSFFIQEYKVDLRSAINYKVNDVMNRIFIKLKEMKSHSQFIIFIKSASKCLLPK